MFLFKNRSSTFSKLAYLFAAIIIWSVCYLNIQFLTEESKLSVQPDAKNRQNQMPVKVVFWLGQSISSGKHAIGQIAQFNKDQEALQQTRTDNNCNCHFTANETEIETADAVLFYPMVTGFKRERLPKYRNSNQIWIMNLREPPANSMWPDPYKNMFNWTLGYRKDCTFWAPYSKSVRIPPEESIKMDPSLFNQNFTLADWISRKSRLIVGVISNCKTASNREKLISQLNSTGISIIDVYGACGNLKTCSRHGHDCTDFWNYLVETYKFYLAFENALCTDYITEKFWRSLDKGIVPVVYGAGNYELDAPPGSYVDMRNFKSAKHLMEYLKYVGGNQTEYAKYFEWRNHYNIVDGRAAASAWCNLCNALMEQKKFPHRIQSYENLFEWWQKKPNSNLPACEKGPTSF